MANILTTAEAASVLHCETDDPIMLILLDILDALINNKTGKDWTIDNPINPIAKDVAIAMLIRRHEDPGAMGQYSSMDDYVRAGIMQLQAIALEEQ